MKHEGDPFLGPHSGPKNGARQPKKRRQNVVSWLARALSRSTAGSLLTTCFSTFRRTPHRARQRCTHLLTMRLFGTPMSSFWPWKASSHFKKTCPSQKVLDNDSYCSHRPTALWLLRPGRLALCVKLCHPKRSNLAAASSATSLGSKLPWVPIAAIGYRCQSTSHAESQIHVKIRQHVNSYHSFAGCHSKAGTVQPFPFFGILPISRFQCFAVLHQGFLQV